MSEDYESWRVHCLTLLSHWHKVEPGRVNESLLRRCFEKHYQPHEAARYVADQLTGPRGLRVIS